ncbi:Programmed cell death 6-interacting protein [Entamoeba marina]
MSHFVPNFSVLPMKKSDTADLTYIVTRALHGSVVSKETQQIIQNLSSFRLQIISHDPSEQLRDMIWKYYNTLHALTPHVSLNISFTWHDTYLKTDGLPTKTTYATIDFEEACMLYNLGCCLHHIAGGQTQSSRPDSLKNAATLFQQAADVFEKAANHASMCTSLTGDVAPNRLKTLVTYSLGCAHLVMYINSVIQNKSQALKLKLSSAAFNQIHSSVVAIHKMYGLLSTSEVLSGMQCVLNYSSYHVHTLAAATALDNLEHGEYIKHLKIAMKAADRGSSLSKMSSQKTSFKQLANTTKTEYNNAVKDNNKIYMKNIPKSKDLPPIPEVQVAKPQPIPELNIKLFALDSTSSAALTNYTSSANRIISDTHSLEQSKYNEGSKIMESLMSRANATQMPQDIANQAAQLKSYNAYNYIQTSFQKIAAFDGETSAAFENGITALDSEAAEDRRLRGQYPYQWKRTNSDVAAFNLRKEVEKFRNALNQAKGIDQNAKRQFVSFGDDIKEIVNGNAQMWFGSGANEQRILQNWNILINKRREIVARLDAIFQQNEKEKMALFNKSNDDSVSRQLLSRFNNGRQEMQQSLYEQDVLLKEVQNLGISNTVVADPVVRMKKAIAVAFDIMKTMEQSLQFHNDALNKIHHKRLCH